jgi:putative peptidoglycan lipid II flippase
VVVLMLTLPDWLAGVLASGALAYVLVPAWAGQSAAQVAHTQRKVAWSLLGGGGVLALLLILLREPARAVLAAGLPAAMGPPAAGALVWSALTLPAALLAALWTTRLQHERDFAGMYSANLVVNLVLIAAIAWAAGRVAAGTALPWLGAGLLAAMFLRLAWLQWRTPRAAEPLGETLSSLPAMPSPPVWLWAVLSAGLPLALPFVARSIASQSGEGLLATFNYAWKLVELPLILAIQLVATLAFPAIARAQAGGDAGATARAVRTALALAWALACAAAAALQVGAPAIAQLLFGWGRMEPHALARVAQWGAIGAWGLLPQALIAVGLTVLAARGSMKVAVAAYALALALLLWLGARGMSDGAHLMLLVNLLLCMVAIAVVAALGPQARAWMPWRSMGVPLVCLLGVGGFMSQAWDVSSVGLVVRLVLATLAAMLVMAATWWSSSDLRAALAR